MFESISTFFADHPGLSFTLAGLVLFGSEFLKYIVTGSNWIVAAIKAAGATSSVTVTGIEGILEALHAITIWAVKNGSPELLAKVTALYQDFQAVNANTPNNQPGAQ